jgi:hypothetical protein
MPYLCQNSPCDWQREVHFCSSNSLYIAMGRPGIAKPQLKMAVQGYNTPNWEEIIIVEPEVAYRLPKCVL